LLYLFAVNVTVCPASCDYTQISDALASVGADTTVLVSAGAYYDSGASVTVSVANVELVYATPHPCDTLSRPPRGRVMLSFSC
jgi:hypothetical protein